MTVPKLGKKKKSKEKVQAIEEYNSQKPQSDTHGTIETVSDYDKEQQVLAVPKLGKKKKSKPPKRVASFSTKKPEENLKKPRKDASVKVVHVNLDLVEDILDKVIFSCETCSKTFISLPGLKSHITKMHKEDEEKSLSGISNFIVDTDPLVPQVKSLAENLPRVAGLNDENLMLQFSILLTFPQFTNLVKTFIRFYQKPVNKIQKDLKDFAESLLRFV